MVVWFGSSGTTPITNGAIKNCVVRNGVNTSSAIVISDGTTSGGAGYFANMEVRNNKIEKAYTGVYANGGTTPANGSGLTYANNELNTSGTNAIRHTGLYMQGVNGAMVTNNEIGNFETATGENDFGIWLASGAMNVTVNANRIHDIGYTGTSGYGAKGIAASTGVTSANVIIANNMIFNMNGDGDSYTSYGCTYTPVGIYAYGSTVQGGIGIFDNSIFLYGNTINYTAAAYSVGIGLDDSSAGEVSGNCVVNNLGRLTTIGTGAVAIALEIAASQLTAGDHNDLYCNSTGGGTNLVGKIAATDYVAMADWRTASGRDGNSISADPLYAGNTDLHIRTDVVSPVSNVGITIAGITGDYDGNLRTATPDIGADEIYALTTAVVGNGSIQVAPVQVVYNGGTSVTLTAIPGNACQTFTGWSGDAGGNTNPLVVVMDSDKSITATFAGVAPPAVAATSPNGGETWTIGTNCLITWTATSDATITAVDLELSLDSGATYPQVIATGLANTGSYSWLVPNLPSTTARVRVTAYDSCTQNATDASDADFTISTDISAIADILLAPGDVLGVYPNPSSPDKAGVLFRLARAGNVTLSIYDVAGRQVRTLESGFFKGGVQNLTWNGKDDSGQAVPTGIYLVRLTSSNGDHATRRMVFFQK